MTKRVLINLIKECIDEIYNECECSKSCACKSGEKITETNLQKELLIKAQIHALKRKYPDADYTTVYMYAMKNPKGVTIKQLENDAKTNNWNDDTIKSIYKLMSHKK